MQEKQEARAEEKKAWVSWRSDEKTDGRGRTYQKERKCDRGGMRIRQRGEGKNWRSTAAKIGEQLFWVLVLREERSSSLMEKEWGNEAKAERHSKGGRAKRGEASLQSELYSQSLSVYAFVQHFSRAAHGHMAVGQCELQPPPSTLQRHLFSREHKTKQVFVSRTAEC